MNSFNIKKLVPIIVAFIAFFAITYVYLMPVFKGKEIVQSDMVSVRGMGKEVDDYRDQYHAEALWTNSMFGGMPAYQISTRYPNSYIVYARTAISLGLKNPANILFTMLVSFFILLLVLKIDPWLSIGGAIAFAFSAYFIILIDAGHVSKSLAISYLPMILAGIILINREKYLTGGALTALSVALELQANHVQITYYFFMFLVIYLAFEWVPQMIKKEFKSILKSVSVMVIAAIIAIGCNITSLLITSEYVGSSIRGGTELTTEPGAVTSGLDKEYATQWSLGISESMSLMIPGFKGEGSNIPLSADKAALKKVDPRFKESIGGTPQYWGDQPFTMSPYAGAIIVFLFVLGLFIVEGPMKWALLGGTILSLLLAWGKNFMPLTEFFLDHVPLYNKFRTVSMTQVIAEFTLPLLGILAVNKLISTDGLLDKKIKLAFTKKEISVKTAFFISLGLTAGVSLLVYLSPSITDLFAAGEYDKIYGQISKSNGDEIANEFMDNLTIARTALLKASAIRSFFFIIIGALAIWLYAKSKINKHILSGALIILFLIDLIPIDRLFVNNENFKNKQETTVPFPLTKASADILEDKDPDYRVLNIAVNTFNESSTAYYHKSIGGYHPAKLRRYQDLIDHHIQNSIQNIIKTLQTQPTDSALRATFSRLGVLNMLNTRYIIYNQEAAPLQNRYALGNAWFVHDINMAKDANESIEKLGTINPASTVIIEEKFAKEIEGFTPTIDGTAQIRLTDYKPNDLKYEASTNKEQLAVFSEIYYDKGWNAYIDGELKPHFGADYVLRAMRIPAGKHTIEFKFEPKKYYLGEKISLASSVILFIALIASVILDIRKKKLL